VFVVDPADGVVVSPPLQDLGEEALDAVRPPRALALDDQQQRADTGRSSSDPGFVNAAARRGVFAHITDDNPEQLQSTLEIVLRRFAEFHNLEGAFGRRAMIERAKGILMATHGIDEEQAFEMLRGQSQRSGRKLLDLAEAVVDSHQLLVRTGPSTKAQT